MEPAKAAIEAMVEVSNAEEGGIAHAFTQDVLQPNILHIVAKRKDEAALATHFATPHMATFGGAVGARFHCDRSAQIPHR